MRCVSCHCVIMNGDIHNLAHGKSMKGLVNYNKNHMWYEFFEKTCFGIIKIYKVGVLGVEDQSCWLDHRKLTKKENNSSLKNHKVLW